MLDPSGGDRGDFVVSLIRRLNGIDTAGEKQGAREGGWGVRDRALPLPREAPPFTVDVAI